jgi:hypothetical protein
MEYTVRSNDGRIRSIHFNKEQAEIRARQTGGYVKSDYDPIYPLKEEFFNK